MLNKIKSLITYSKWHYHPYCVDAGGGIELCNVVEPPKNTVLFNNIEQKYTVLWIKLRLVMWTYSTSIRISRIRYI